MAGHIFLEKAVKHAVSYHIQPTRSKGETTLSMRSQRMRHHRKRVELLFINGISDGSKKLEGSLLKYVYR